MKRLISLLVALAMLTGMCITAGAQLPGTTSYFEDFEDGALSAPFSTVNGYGVAYFGVLEGVGDETEKYGDKVYKMSQAAEWTAKYSGLELGVKMENTHNTYADGEKVHMTSQIMIPAGTKFYRDPAGSPSVMANVFVDESGAAYELGVQNAGDATYNDGRQVNSVVTFSDNKKIMLFGSQIHTTTTWAYDTWYTVDVVLVMGSKPQAAIYVNGEPLRIDPKFNDDLTFDGVNTSTDYISVGYRVTDTANNTSAFTEAPIKGVGNYYPVRAAALHEAPEDTAVYVDNIGYKALAANQEADIYTPFALAGIKDGDVVDRADLATATVTIPKWDAADIAKVSITVDGAETALAEDAEAPYVFDLSKLERGIRTLTLNGYNANDELVKTRDYSISVAGNETHVRTDCDFEGTKATIYGTELFQERNGIECVEVADSDGVSYGRSLQISASANSPFGQAIPLYYRNKTLEGYDSGMAYMEYDMYIANDAVTNWQVSSNTTYIIGYNSDTKKFVGTNYGYLRSAYDYSFPATFGKWQRWVWLFDYTTSKITLWIDGTPVINNATMENPTQNLVREFEFVFNNASETENFVALDNFKVWRKNALPVKANDMSGDISSITGSGRTFVNTGELKTGVVYAEDGETPLNPDFGNSLLMEIDAVDAAGSGKYIQVGSLFDTLGKRLTAANGITTIEYDIYLQNSDYTALNFEVNNEYLWQSKNMGVCAAEAPKIDLTPGAWHHHKFVLTPPATAGGKPSIAVYVDGKHVRTTPANTNFAYDTPFLAFALTPAASAEDANLAKPILVALDNLSQSYEPIVPYMKGVAFDAASAYGEVVSSATTATITMGGVPVLAADKVSVVNADGTALEGASASVSGNTITVSGLALTAGNTYRIEIAKGLGFDNNSMMATTEKMSYAFKAVEALPVAAAATDGVQSIKFFRHNSAGDNAYAPGDEFVAWDRICAEARVNNLSNEAKSFNLVLATYDASGRLQKVSVGDCSVLANSVGRTVSSGYIVLEGANEEAGTPGDDLDITMKAFVLDSMGNLAPLGPVVLSDPQA